MLEEFKQRWLNRDSSPDVFAFLANYPHVALDEQLAILLHDQKMRWKSNVPMAVEDYLAKVPNLPSEFVLELVKNEYQSRRELRSEPDLPELILRFPELSDQLKQSLSQWDDQRTEETQTGLTQSSAFFAYTPKPEQPSDIQSEDPTLENLAHLDTNRGLTQSYVTKAKIGDHRRGRYRLVRTLGQGGFGVVYLAIDEELRRQVAVKVPAADRFHGASDIDSYLTEARTVASLDHPNIVPVYDLGRTDDGSIYVVSKFIDGRTLTQLIGSDYPLEDIAGKLIAPIALALDCAHRHQLIHRDVKPGNILIEDETGTPYLADFGLAIRVEDYLSNGSIAGTPAYMSPECARGEGHRLDGRSDIFSLGVVFYELLTSKRAFRGSTNNELYHQVISVEPIRPRELNESIPAELERICLKAISKRASDRYATAADFADDLLNWRGGISEGKHEHSIVPKGLRSFDSSDAEFFLDLLPGPRDRHGLPASIQFWKTRIEETDPDQTFSVGLVYGPSGCGKSSLVKAGLIPHLSLDVLPIYVEATLDETENRILRGLLKHLPDLPRDLGLAETFAWLRQRNGRKVVIILDQFEQWLHAHRVENDGELVRALRQCDGVALQALVMVRDDFAMAAARFMDKIEVPILQGHNFTTVDLFDQDHAQRVLIKFGQAFGKLPAQVNRLTEEEKQFVSTVAAGLAVDGKVVSVRLSLFAEMIKSKQWIPSTLEAVGGTQGIGVNFLEETFGSRSANPSHRLHEAAARQVLQSLLPEVGSDIKGHMRSQADLASVSGYQEQTTSFKDLMRILDGELRLITPTDPEGFRTESGSELSEKYFQLTHDYLVQALRIWLQRKQLETRKGRAEIRLAQRSAMWIAKSENRQLPSLREYVSIVALTTRSNWTQVESQMMATARRLYRKRLLFGGIIAAVCVVFSAGLARQIDHSRQRSRVYGLVDQLLVAKTADVPNIATLLEDELELSSDPLRSIAADTSRTAMDRLRANYVLAHGSGEHSAQMIRDALCVDPESVQLARDRLTPLAAKQIKQLWASVENPATTMAERLRASALLAVADPSNESWPAFSQELVNTLMDESSFDRDRWAELLRPVAKFLMPHWRVYAMDPTVMQSRRAIAVSVLSRYADAELLCELLLNAEPNQFQTLFQGVPPHESTVVTTMSRLLEEYSGGAPREGLHNRMLLNAMLTLLQLGQLKGNETILEASADPTLRTMFIVHAYDYLVPADILLTQYEQLSHPTARQASLLALASYRVEELPADFKPLGLQKLADVLRNSQTASERSAAEILLRRWELESRINEIELELAISVVNATQWLQDHDWWVNSKQHVMCVIDPPLTFTAGSPANEFLREEGETQTDVIIPYRFAVDAHEVSIKQYERFRPIAEIDFPNSSGTNLPANRISLVQAMQYCRWLSEQEGIAEDQMCYPTVDEIELDDFFLTDDQLLKPGYRLLTEYEWEGVCRASSMTTWFTGGDPEMMNFFCCTFPKSGNRPCSIGMMLPNAWGMFDMQGNIMEWCHVSGTQQRYSQKGGNFKQTSSNFRSARRYAQSGVRYSYNGFRVACTLPNLAGD